MPWNDPTPRYRFCPQINGTPLMASPSPSMSLLSYHFLPYYDKDFFLWWMCFYGSVGRLGIVFRQNPSSYYCHSISFVIVLDEDIKNDIWIMTTTW